MTEEAITLEANPGAPLGTYWHLNYQRHDCRGSKVVQLLHGRAGQTHVLAIPKPFNQMDINYLSARKG